jgi:TonB family protein
LEQGGTTNWKNKAGHFGNGCSIAWSAVRCASRKRRINRDNEVDPVKLLLSMKALAAIVFLTLQSLAADAQSTKSAPPPALVSFVAPAYPRVAHDLEMQGTTVTHITVGKDGSVTDARNLRAHVVFAKYVLDAWKQWKFAPSEEEHEFDVTCRFEFYAADVNACKEPNGQSTTPETIVSFALPTEVLIRTTGKCMQITNPDSVPKHNP